jgi:methyl-accepting chemotaxis protein
MGLKNLSIKGKLTLVTGLFVVGIAVFALIAFNTLNEVKIGGQLYTEISAADEVNNDYVPADGHLGNAFSLCVEMETDEKDKDQGDLHTHIDAFEKARSRFEEIHDKTSKSVGDGPLKETFEKAYTPGHDFLEIAHNKYIPLLLAGNYTDADALLDGDLERLFKIHDAANAEFSNFSEKILADVQKKADDTVASRTVVLILVPIVAVGLVAILCFVVARGILSPLKATVEVLHEVSQGNLTRRLEVTGKDEIAQMGIALNDTVDNLSRIMSEIGSDAKILSDTSRDLSTNSQELGANSQQTTTQAAAVSSAAEEVSRNVQTVSTATEEMSASIKEISKNASEAAEVASSAARLAGSTTTTMTKLSESSAEIGNVVKVITSIAEQTNLLALNATIEAARAGEAGKGFAVVANEVKELAKETAKATEDIGNKVEAIQNDAKGAVQAIDEITTVIGRINDIQNTIASAVEEQTGTTNEISRNISETARGSSDIASNITGVASAAKETQKSASASLLAAGELSKLAVRLGNVVSQFKLASNGHIGSGGRAG